MAYLKSFVRRYPFTCYFWNLHEWGETHCLSIFPINKFGCRLYWFLHCIAVVVVAIVIAVAFFYSCMFVIINHLNFIDAKYSRDKHIYLFMIIEMFTNITVSHHNCPNGWHLRCTNLTKTDTLTAWHMCVCFFNVFFKTVLFLMRNKNKMFQSLLMV